MNQAKRLGSICEEYNCREIIFGNDADSRMHEIVIRGLEEGSYKQEKCGEHRLISEGDKYSWIMSKGVEKNKLQKARLLSKVHKDMRNLVNAPANQLTPEIFAEEAVKKGGACCQVIRREQLEKEGYGALLAVGQGSGQEPCLVVLRHMKGKKDDAVLGIIGKGITFDSGGLCIKPGTDMSEMVADMGGAAAAFGVWQIVHQENLPMNLIVVLALAENMPGGNACRPGDVVRTASGKTVEVINTDAEGRLALADGMEAAIKGGATHLIDVATLTGAARVAFGREAVACMTNEDKFFQQVRHASETALERVWLMPSYSEYGEQLKSKAADLKNLGDGKGAGMQVAGMFVKAFTRDLPWVHMDIGGSAAPGQYDGDGFTVPMLYTLTELCYSWCREDNENV